MSVYVFLGPSLDRARAKSLLDAHYLPPVKMGDVSALLQEKPKAIGIIDGYFEYTPAVWHKEVLFALASGVRVFGGGSMGALRAAELHPFGMEGIGQTFDAYAGGTLEDDDEVAVAHGRAEDGFLTLSDAMVNLRHGLALAVEAKCIVPSTKSKLEEVAKALFYPERSWGALYSAAPSLGVERHEIEALRNFVDEVKPDIKRDDAELVLRTMAARLTNDVPAPRAEFYFESTIFWEQLQTVWRPKLQADDFDGVVHAQIRNHVRLADEERELLRHKALLLIFVQNEARRFGLGVGDTQNALERFRRKRSLTTGQSLIQWLENEHVSKEELVLLARLEAILVLVERRYADRIDAELGTALKLDGRYGRTRTKVATKWHKLGASGISAPSASDAGIPMDDILGWYQDRHGKITVPLDQHIAELGLARQQFFTELVAEYIVEMGA